MHLDVEQLVHGLGAVTTVVQTFDLPKVLIGQLRLHFHWICKGGCIIYFLKFFFQKLVPKRPKNDNFDFFPKKMNVSKV